MSPSVVNKFESAFKVPFSKVVSVGMGIDGGDDAIWSFDNKEVVLIEGPFLLIVVIVVAYSSVFVENKFSQHSTVIDKFPLVLDKNIDRECVPSVLDFFTCVPFLVNSEAESEGKKQRYDQDLIHLYYNVSNLIWHLKWSVLFSSFCVLIIFQKEWMHQRVDLLVPSSL